MLYLNLQRLTFWIRFLICQRPCLVIWQGLLHLLELTEPFDCILNHDLRLHSLLLIILEIVTLVLHALWENINYHQVCIELCFAYVVISVLASKANLILHHLLVKHNTSLLTLELDFPLLWNSPLIKVVNKR